MNEHFYMIGYVADAHFGIPSCFPCGGRIVDEVSTNPKYLADSSTLPGSRYFSCKDFDGSIDLKRKRQVEDDYGRTPEEGIKMGKRHQRNNITGHSFTW
ncbi:hypothetical protein F2Q69_00059822 [Brassica cretica]|uniref:Uncharacterized protein n=1 Tax=Brassica cretica TaxID=69181 RepID=A0A8S9RIJ1_BRACR|nr:hypothetical protein F2Q69_00059822 [Brassica cretica]